MRLLLILFCIFSQIRSDYSQYVDSPLEPDDVTQHISLCFKGKYSDKNGTTSGVVEVIQERGSSGSILSHCTIEFTKNCEVILDTVYDFCEAKNKSDENSVFFVCTTYGCNYDVLKYANEIDKDSEIAKNCAEYFKNESPEKALLPQKMIRCNFTDVGSLDLEPNAVAEKNGRGFICSITFDDCHYVALKGGSISTALTKLNDCKYKSTWSEYTPNTLTCVCSEYDYCNIDIRYWAKHATSDEKISNCGKDKNLTFQTLPPNPYPNVGLTTTPAPLPMDPEQPAGNFNPSQQNQNPQQYNASAGSNWLYSIVFFLFVINGR